MKRVVVVGNGLCDWRARLAKPDLHWKRGASAFETAVSWELAQRTASGIPPAVASLLDKHSVTESAVALFIVPEHKVSIPGKGKPSQNDVWVLAKNASGLISMSVEGKAGEPFDDTIEKWLDVEEDANRRVRLNGLCELLGGSEPGPELRYQLFHRAASAVLEAERFGASTAVLMIQAFGSKAKLDDVRAFCAYLKTVELSDNLSLVPNCSRVTLLVGSAVERAATDADIAKVAV